MALGDEQTEKAEAEFSAMAHSTVAVIVYADAGVQYEYPQATLSLSSVVAAVLRKNIEGAQTIDPIRIRRYQHENFDWNSMDKASLGELFGADYVLFIALRQYTTKEPGSLNIYRGRINAEASIFNVHRPDGTPAEWTETYLEVTFPPDAATGVVAANDEPIRYYTEKAFANLLIRRFYEHEVSKYQ
ncbi:MAG TPA: hypothetical protein ENH80_09815 [Phycisphaerae bacterium]|nr:hypothetical protein [Phycisphaerae bacterium]HDZ44222.1 hypothetical protein [Phycisphaerae bacterium]